ncbi:Ankyrin repeat domain-containing 50 [Fusarium albosuccineum]|uniref:Ankyrin repeat domain-containing 50 n=1 Tax=Fusarium albosuccineum TaxID=1237068 RepID=A0A8H4PGZ2_9HYPO|nr:Ankyrin repeat domain-containing 50 [Fusarium albosuccineum]
MDPLSTTSSVIAVIQLSSEIVSYISGAIGATKERMRLSNEILGCESILQLLKDKVNSSDQGEAWTQTLKTLEASDGPLGRLWAALSALKAKLEPQKGLQKALSILKWPLNEREVKLIIDSMEHEKSLLSLALANNSRNLMMEIKKCSNGAARRLGELIQALEKSSNESRRQFMKIENILISIDQSHDYLRREADGVKQYGDDRERRAVLNWLSPTDNASQQSDTIYRRHTGTGYWLINSAEFRTWLDTAKQILFCPGIPGAGKTIITAIVVDHLSARFDGNGSVGIAYLYCNYRQQQQQKAEHLLASLLRQLIHGQPYIPDCVQALYNRFKDRRRGLTFHEISTTLHTVIALYSRVYIVADALDECQEFDGCRARFMDEILSLRDKAGANLFATSRRMSQLPSFVRRCPELQDEIKYEIIKTVEGMFLLAQLHLDSLMAKRSPKAMKIALKRLPVGYEAYDVAYDTAMERIQGQLADSQRLAKQVLSWVMCARRPLTITELRYALAVEKGEPVLDEENVPDIEDMIAVCAGLVMVDGASDTVRLVHHTARHYFERTRLRWFPDAEVDIANVCLTYLSFDAFEDGFCTTDEMFEARLRTNVLYDYAARNWGHHVCVARISFGDDILEFLGCESKIASSTQALMAFGSFPGYSQSVPRQMTAAHLAAYFGLGEEMRILIDHGHDPDCRDTHGRTPLSLAAENGYEVVVGILLEEYRVDPDPEDTDSWTPLAHAAANDHRAVTEVLIAAEGVDLNSQDSNGRTPLFHAAGDGHEAVVRLILANGGADPNHKDSSGWTALSYASWYGHRAVVKVLLEQANIDVNSKDSGGWSALSLAAGEGHEEIVRLLLGSPIIDWDSTDDDGRTPLSWAAQNGHEPVVQLLITDFRVDPDAKDSNGKTPLQWAKQNRQEGVVRLLSAKLSYSIVHNSDEMMDFSWPPTGFTLSERPISMGNTSVAINILPLMAQTTLGILQYTDTDPAAPKSIDVDIQGILDRGFFKSGNDWTCYRRSYFRCICSFNMMPCRPGVSMQFVQAGTSQTYQVYGFAMTISAFIMDDERPIQLVQHTPMRDRGPVLSPEKVRLSPKGLESGLHMGLHPATDDQGCKQEEVSHATEHAFERVQFSTATRNNVKKRDPQQYFQLRAELWADVGERAPGFIMIAYRNSVALVVRGRSPGHYQSR